jgi:hypothetical protein
VVLLESGSFGVEVSIPDSHPTTVSMFKTEADAEAWIAEHRRLAMTASACHCERSEAISARSLPTTLSGRCRFPSMPPKGAISAEVMPSARLSDVGPVTTPGPQKL